jgi:hypothetical protein
MKSSVKPLAWALASLALLTLHGCGGGSDSSPAQIDPPAVEEPTDTPPAEPPAAAKVSISGLVAGPLAGATVCLDINANRDCDSGEPTATTDAAGKYQLNDVAETDAASKPLIVKVVAGTSTQAGAAIAANYTLAAPAGQGAVITPYTTLVQSEIDGDRAPNRAQAETNILNYMVGVAGDVGGLTLYSDYLGDDSVGTPVKRGKMAGLGQLLTAGFAKTGATSGLTGQAALGALGQAATGSLQQVLSQVPAPLSDADRDDLFQVLQDSLVPTAAHLKDVAAAQGKAGPASIEGAWVRDVVRNGATVRELFLFAGDGTFVHQIIDPGIASVAGDASTRAFDNGFGYRYGRYSQDDGTLKINLIEASEAAGPAEGTLTVSVGADTLVADASGAYTRVAGDDPLVGGWVRPNGSNTPEFLVLFGDRSYVHSTFYYQNDPQTGSATYFETAKSAGVRKGAYARDGGNTSVVNFGDTTVLFNGNLAIPSNPGVAHIQADGSISMTGLRLVKLGSTDGAKAVTGFSEATRSRLWSGRYFSRTINVSGTNRTQYVYVRGPNDVLTFLQPTATANPLPSCGDVPAQIVDFTSVSPADGTLKQFVVGTGTAASAGYAQRRLNIGQPGSMVSYTPIARPTNATARCALPL